MVSRSDNNYLHMVDFYIYVNLPQDDYEKWRLINHETVGLTRNNDYEWGYGWIWQYSLW